MENHSPQKKRKTTRITTLNGHRYGKKAMKTHLKHLFEKVLPS
ncbi:hypothetical protein HMPREF9442_02042 [Paraprevotella xylaniphila YIT 11841]|uniref:Uncharacterized protein n=1 Tax=Paraprevotella xylaniphila YIT 11841 TaxID=762982 RepID=F3QV18_9BACT|nr:hypothetical protein HMPREF9442_02042 [Paraprevotella xylaniphila YIT 11841]